MGKHGPCRHCGVATTPLWRNGPPDKPVLCNACGSRWRTKGSLTNYTPLHARELIDSEEFKVSKVTSIPFKPKEKKVNKIKQTGGPVGSECEMPYSDQNFRKILEADTSNRSSSGSAISYSESFVHVGTTEASDLTGSAQSNVWDSLVPSKKRTCVARPKPSSVEKLTKDLCTILHEQQSFYRSSTEEDLLYPTPMGSFEIGTGSVLLKFPNQKTVEEESEASSLPRDNKSYVMNDTYSGSPSFPVHSRFKGTGVSDVCAGKLNKSAAYMAQERMKRDKTFSDQLHIPRDIDSPLGFTDLKDEKREQNSAGKGVATGHSSLTPLKRPLDIQNQHVPEPNDTMRSPNRLSKSVRSGTYLPSTITSHPNSKSIYDAEEFVDTDGACFSPRSFFATSPDRSSIPCHLHFTDASTDHELLLDVPSNMSSYSEAELLCHPWNRKPGVPNNSPPESRSVADEDESLSNFPHSSLGSQQTTPR